MPDDNQEQYLSMSDADIENMIDSPFSNGVPDAEINQVVPDDTGVVDDNTAPLDDSPMGEDGGDGEADEDLGTQENSELSGEDLNEEEELTTESEESSDEEPENKLEGAEAELARLYAPIKANGKEIQIRSMDDAIKLIQMGANYNKKMAGLKPHLKFVKMLDKHDLLDESKLNFVIDLMAKKPEAIAKFVEDSGIDPLDLDNIKTEDYQPQSYTVSDQEVELDGVLRDIEHTPSYAQTLDTINNKLDAASRKVLLSNPDSIRTINDHIASGLYEYVMNIVDQERMVGRLVEYTDLDAYKFVGQQLQEAEKSGGSQKSPAPNVAQANQLKRQKDIEAERKRKKQAAAAPTGSATKSKAKDSFDPLALSDEEFEAQAKKLGLSHI